MTRTLPIRLVYVVPFGTDLAALDLYQLSLSLCFVPAHLLGLRTHRGSCFPELPMLAMISHQDQEVLLCLQQLNNSVPSSCELAQRMNIVCLLNSEHAAY